EQAIDVRGIVDGDLCERLDRGPAGCVNAHQLDVSAKAADRKGSWRTGHFLEPDRLVEPGDSRVVKHREGEVFGETACRTGILSRIQARRQGHERKRDAGEQGETFPERGQAYHYRAPGGCGIAITPQDTKGAKGARSLP